VVYFMSRVHIGQIFFLVKNSLIFVIYVIYDHEYPAKWSSLSSLIICAQPHGLGYFAMST